MVHCYDRLFGDFAKDFYQASVDQGARSNDRFVRNSFNPTWLQTAATTFCSLSFSTSFRQIVEENIAMVLKKRGLTIPSVYRCIN